MRNSRVRRHFTKSLAAFTTVAIVGATLGTSAAQAATPPPAEKPLSVTLTATPSAPFIDGNSGTSVAAAITNMVGVTDQDVLYLGLLDQRGTVTSRVTVVPGKANSSGDVTTGSATFTISKSGNLGYRLWVDQEDPTTGTRNRTWDNSVDLNEPTKTGTFAFAGNPAAVTLSDSAAKPLGSLVTVNEGTCKVFRALVVDGAGTPVRDQQLQITFEAGAVGNHPQPCLASDLDSVSKSAATGTSPAGIMSGSTDITGAVSFALKGAKGVPAWTGSVEVRVVDPKANASAVASFTMTTNPGGNNAVQTINPVAPAKVSRLSNTRVALTALDRFGQPLQGVTLLANSVATPTAVVSLAATDMNGTTALTVDTSVLGLQTLNIWANKTGAGFTDGLDAGEKSVQVKIEVIPQVVDIASQPLQLRSLLYL